MADGFKKYFNSTTIHGRANVAKATYASIVLLYVFYRVRCGLGKKTDELAQTPQTPDCSCEKSEEPVTPTLDQKPDGPKPECKVCRERPPKKQPNENKCHDAPDEPPPPPSSTTLRKCPCNKPSNAEASWHNTTSHDCEQSSNCDAELKQPLHKIKLCAPEMEPVKPARQLMGRLQEAVHRVLRNVFGAPVDSNTLREKDTAQDCNELAACENQDEFNEQLEQECEPDVYNECVSNTNEVCCESSTMPEDLSSDIIATPKSTMSTCCRYFNDGFASELLYDDIDE